MPILSLSLLLQPLLVAQAGPPALPVWLKWLYVWGEPGVTVQGPFAGAMTWIKVVGLFGLMGWAGSWVFTALQDSEAHPARKRRVAWLDYAALLAIIAGVVAAFLGVRIVNKQMSESLSWIPSYLGLGAGLIIAAWLEFRIFSALKRLGTRGDRVVLVGLHLALALGFGVGLLFYRFGAMPDASWQSSLVLGGRLGATYMGLVLMLRLVSLLLPEFSALQFRRLYAIAWQSWTEAFRRMWAPWVVIAVFAVILAFTSWFLQPPRPAELGKLYVGTLMLLTSLLVTLAIVILAPISLPNDVRQQTIFTVVSKPVRRLELVWGRIIGYMALVTVLLAFFAVVSLIYYSRQVGAAITEAEAKAKLYTKENKTELARIAQEQVDQLRTRMGARVPVYGALMFFDSKGNPKRHGIDVGIELPMRSFIEGASPSQAIWKFGRTVPNPLNDQELLDRAVPVDTLLQSGTIEWAENKVSELAQQSELAKSVQSAGNLKAADVKKIHEAARQAQTDVKRYEAQLENLRKQEAALKAAGKTTEAYALHSPPVPVEMTFTVYRTTKGQVGEPVFAQVVVTNPRPEVAPFSTILAVKEYYTNKLYIPARVLVGSKGELTVAVQCKTVNQYLGMAEGDLFLLASQGTFWSNYLKGLLGIWLQAMVLTAIGVCAGTFLSWPVALLITVAFFLAGNVGFTALQQFALSAELVGGGPFESMFRMLAHDNLMTELDPTPAVVIAKTLDSIVMPVMARLVYLVPNFSALDVSNLVADGFAVTGETMLGQVLLALGYALPFSIAGYFILRNREVAA